MREIHGPGFPDEPLLRMESGQPVYAADPAKLAEPRGHDLQSLASHAHQRDQLAVSADNVALAAESLRKAQRDYLDDRGNEAKGRAVAMTAGALDRALAVYWAVRKSG